MANFTTNVGKWGLRRLLGTSSVREVDDGFTALADDIDPLLTPFDSGLFDDRPTSTPAQPGKAGREYLATDRGVLYKDYGTGWIALNEEIGNISWRSIDNLPPGGTHLEANGQTIPATGYPLYSSLIGTKHGGTASNPALPDAGERVIVGRASGANRIPNSPRDLAQAGGEERHALTGAESGMPGVSHSASAVGYVSIDQGGGTDGSIALMGGLGSGVKQVSQRVDVSVLDHPPRNATNPHNIMQPYLVLLPLVRVA